MERDKAYPKVGKIKGASNSKWINNYNRNAAPGEHACDFVWDYTGPADGPFCTDANGNVFIDFTSHLGAAPLGYNNPKIIDKLGEFSLIDPLKVAGQDFYVAGGGTPENPDYPGPSLLMEKIIDITSHYDMDLVFLSNSGAEAIENAIKISYNFAKPANHMITFQGAFHGRTTGALSLTRSGDHFTRGFPELTGVRDVPFCDNRECTPSSCSCGFYINGVPHLQRMLDPNTGWINPSEVACIFLEPVQGVGGYRFPSEKFINDVGDICTNHNILMVVDEVQSGLGRTGEWWASDHYNINPDVIVSAKALRVGATVSSKAVFPAEPNRLGSTWGAGDILGSIIGTFTIEAIEEHNLMRNSLEQGRNAIERLQDDVPNSVVDIRGKGLMVAIEMDSQRRRDEIIQEAFRRGVIITACGSNTIRILPPLDVMDREIEIGIDLVTDAINGI